MRKVFLPLFLVITFTAVSEPEVLGLTSVRLIAPDQFKSGDDVPIVVYAVDEFGAIDVDVSGIYTLNLGSQFPEGQKVKLQKGSGSITVNIESDADVLLSIEGAAGQRIISAADSPPVQTHTGAINAAGELWDSSFEHHIEDDVTVPAGAELTISEGTRIIVHGSCNLLVNGSIRGEGTQTKPILFTSATLSEPWGGIEIQNAIGLFEYCFFIHGGSDGDRIFGHSQSQPVLKGNYADVTLINCFLLDNTGKALGGYISRITVTSCLLSRCDTGGEFHSSQVAIDDTYVLDIPVDDGISVDDDNDGFYFLNVYPDSEESSTVENSYFITGKDDGIDQNGAHLEISNCWIEGFHHEGVATSTANSVRVFNTVVKGCGQGIEAGYGTPEVVVDHCVVVENGTGLRFGDSYAWGCAGQMTVTNTIVYGNDDNIRNYDILSEGPVDDGILIRYSMTNDPDYDDSEQCITGVPRFDSAYFLTAGSPGTASAMDSSDMGRVLANTVSSIRINEFVAQNSSYTDEFGETDDWIELYNAGDTEIDIGGMFVTNDLDDKTKWQIPSNNPVKTTIAPGGFLVLWFDNTPEQGVLHIEAQLSADGEDIGLYNTDGLTLLDSITFGQQTENISFGRVTDGADSWKTFSTPTPGMSNNVNNETQLNSPLSYSLGNNFPNPFNQSTVIPFSLPKNDYIEIAIYNVVGQRIAILYNGYQTAGGHTIGFDASHLTSGIYYYYIHAGKFHTFNKMTLLK